MIDSPFMKSFGKEKQRDKDRDYRNQGKMYKHHDDKSVTYYYFNDFFKNGVGERVVTLARLHKVYPPKLENKSICMDFHMKGKCNKGTSCPYASSHSYILTNSFRYLILYLRKLLDKYEQDDEASVTSNDSPHKPKSNLKKPSKPTKQIPAKIKKEKQEVESRVEG